MDSFSKLKRFHAKEYPAYDKDVFPCNMGYCQIGELTGDPFLSILAIYKLLFPGQEKEEKEMFVSELICHMTFITDFRV